MRRASWSDLGDAELIRKVIEGERECFAVLVARYQRQVLALGMSFFRDAVEAEDFSQEVFLRAYRKLGSFEGRSKFSTWLLRIGYNLGINSLSRGRRTESLPDGFEAPDWVTPEDERIAAEARDEVNRAVAELPPEAAVCVEMSFYQGLSYAEVSDATGMPVNTIKSHVFRAKKRLRERLKGLSGGEG